VICLDNFFTGSKDNVAHLLDRTNFELIRHDVVQPILLEVDEVYHLACPASPIHYKYNPIKTLKTAFLGTMNMLGLAKRCRAKFLITSTSEVYGDPLEHPQTEAYWGNVNCIGERSCYDEGKRVSETLTMDYHREHNLDIRERRTRGTDPRPQEPRARPWLLLERAPCPLHRRPACLPLCARRDRPYL